MSGRVTTMLMMLKLMMLKMLMMLKRCGGKGTVVSAHPSRSTPCVLTHGRDNTSNAITQRVELAAGLASVRDVSQW